MVSIPPNTQNTMGTRRAKPGSNRYTGFMRPPDQPTLCQGRYRLLEILGEGGMAVVYRAFDEHLRVERAIKLLVPAAARLPEARGRLETEARAMVTLAHPNVVSVYDIRRDERELFLVMELVTGGTLWDWVRGYGAMHPRLASELMLPVLDAIQAAHAAGVIHRDIKPHNIMLDAHGTPKVADFGIAHVQAPLRDGSYTRTGTVLGTWAFMAPEQRHSARQVDERTDVYALGATFYSLITSEPPFDLFAADQDSRLLAGIPPALAQIIRRATRYDPDERFPSASAMAQAFSAALPGLDPTPSDSPPLGIAPTHLHDKGDDTADFDSQDDALLTGGPAADLIFGRRQLHSAPFEDDSSGPGTELALHWKLLVTIGPAMIAAVAGGAVMFSRGDGPSQHREEASVLLSGDAVEVSLLDHQGQAHQPGPLPAGHYLIRALFPAAAQPVDAGELQLQAGAELTLDCQAQTQRCAPLIPSDFDSDRPSPADRPALDAAKP